MSRYNKNIIIKTKQKHTKYHDTDFKMYSKINLQNQMATLKRKYSKAWEKKNKVVTNMLNAKLRTIRWYSQLPVEQWRPRRRRRRWHWQGQLFGWKDPPKIKAASHTKVAACVLHAMNGSIVWLVSYRFCTLRPHATEC